MMLYHPVRPVLSAPLISHGTMFFLTTKQRQPAYKLQKRSAEQSIIEYVTNNMFCFTVYMNQIGDWTVGTAVSLSQLDAQFRMPNAL
jgi:hypothetical protein